MRLAHGLTAIAASLLSTVVFAANVAIVQGSFYTPNLRNRLVNAGHTVTEITTYTAASLAPYALVIHYGNSFTDTTALETYVQNGGHLLLTPWAGTNFAVPANIRSITNNAGCDNYSIPSPGITILAPADPLLAGSSPPTAPGATNIGRECAVTFEPGATQVLNWTDGVAMLGYRSFGSGVAIQLNLHLITSDTAYQVVDQPWANQIVSTAAGPVLPAGPAIEVPLPISAVIGAGLLLAGFGGWRLRRRG